MQMVGGSSQRGRMDLTGARDLLDLQSGIVKRGQLLELGATKADVRRWLRRRELVPVHAGVYVNHTGPLTWTNRAWSAVLLHWPAALSHESAVNLAGDPIHVAVEHDRTPEVRPGVQLHWLHDLDSRVLWNLAPPRVRLEDAVITLCDAAATRVTALTIASDICRRRRTTPERLLLELGRRNNVRHRAWLEGVLRETSLGVQSALESSYLRRVERPHGLPRGRRQRRQRTAQGVVYRDVVYEDQGVLVELDGRVGHDLSRDRWNDMDRDLDAAATDRITLRVGWRQTEDEACRTAHRIGRVLQLRGWSGRCRPCGPACPSTQPIGATG
jgi:hypothetical protein